MDGVVLALETSYRKYETQIVLRIKGEVMSFYIMQMKGFVGIDVMTVLKRCCGEEEGT